MRRGTVIGACTAAVACAAALVPGGSPAKRFEPTDRETFLVSRAADGGFPNGASSHPSISQNRQLASVVAYQSEASDIVDGDSNGFGDVFAVLRKKPYSLNGEPWRAGTTLIVSRGLNGAPANGPSRLPDVSGDHFHAPRCIAFVSDASNLVPGDTNGQPDAFVYDLRSKRTARVSVGSRGQQADGPTSEVEIDGSCTRAAFVSDASNLALTSGGGPRRAFVTTSPPRGTRQVYVHVLDGRGANAGLKGVTFLASASTHGAPANKSSFEVAMSKLGPRRVGDGLAFASDATNLDPRDRTPAPDVYVRVFGRRPHTTLASVNRAGHPGNGASDEPAISDKSRYVAFRTAAHNLLAGDPGIASQIGRVDLSRPRSGVQWVSKSRALDEPGNGDSARPAIGSGGTPVFFESIASNLQPNAVRDQYFDRNGSVDVFFWNSLTRNASLQSRDSDNEVPGNNAPADSHGHRSAQAPASHPATSNLGNYMLFDSGYPLLDLPIARAEFPQYANDPEQARADSNANPALRQVYLRYIGPR